MNQHDTTMMIAAHIAAALTAEALRPEGAVPQLQDADFSEDPNGRWMKAHGYYYMRNLNLDNTPAALKEGQVGFTMITTLEDRIARHAATVANATVHAVQRKLNQQ